MWGAIIGDLIGSIYEFDQIKKITNININSICFDNTFFSDDTILTVSLCDAILHDKNYESYLKQYTKNYESYKPDFKPYFKTTFSPNFIKWAYSKNTGVSTGNGAMMRISPVGYMFDNVDDVIKNAHSATMPSHNSREAIFCATIVSLVIYLARCNYSKEQIIEKLNLNFSYKPFLKLNSTCFETIDNTLYATFSSQSFEEAICKVIGYGGDTDTNACIVGAMAEALYGVDKWMIDECKTKIPNEFVNTILQGYERKRKA